MNDPNPKPDIKFKRWNSKEFVPLWPTKAGRDWLDVHRVAMKHETCLEFIGRKCMIQLLDQATRDGLKVEIDEVPFGDTTD